MKDKTLTNDNPTQHHPDSRLVACKREGCTEAREIPEDVAPSVWHMDLIRSGWGVDSNAWLCPPHLAERDQPHVEAAIAEQERIAEEQKRAAEEQEKLPSTEVEKEPE